MRGNHEEVFPEVSEECSQCIIKYIIYSLCGYCQPCSFVSTDLAQFCLSRLCKNDIFLFRCGRPAPLFHQTPDNLMVQTDFTTAQLRRNPAVTIAAFVFVVYSRNLCFLDFVFVRTVHLFQIARNRCAPPANSVRYLLPVLDAVMAVDFESLRRFAIALLLFLHYFVSVFSVQ